ncbi:MAG: glycosyltransferase family 39 protein [Candidatus Saelkia tenebricola]|nr:glycosyltransferase family 39 protein [Candidatus Saelkia tenebricola]
MEKKSVIFLAVLIVVIAILHFIFLKQDELYPVHDEYRSFSASIQYFHALKSDPSDFFKKIRSNVIPPLQRLLPVPFYVLFGENTDVMAGVNFLWVIMLVISTYLLGRKLLTPIYGLIAVIILLGFPGIIGFSRACHHSVALTAVVVLSHYLLISSRFFEDKKYTLFWAIINIIGFLIHPYFIFFVIPGVFFYILNIKRSSPAYRNFFIACLLMIIIPAIWCLAVLIDKPARELFFSYLSRCVQSENLGSQFSKFIYEIKTFLIPYYGVLYLQISTCYYWVGLISILYAFMEIIRFKKKELICIFLWVVISFFILIFHPAVLLPKHTIPLLPGVAILITYAIGKVGEKVNIKFLFILTCSLSIVSFVELKHSKSNPVSNYFIIGKVFPMSKIRNVDEIINIVREKDKAVEIGVVPDNLCDVNPFIIDVIKYACAMKKISSRVQFEDLLSLVDNAMLPSDIIDKSDFIFYIESDFESDFPGYRKEHLLALQDEFKKRLGEFIFIKEITMDYETYRLCKIKIFKRIKR